jgi:hypothetical protein
MTKTIAVAAALAAVVAANEFLRCILILKSNSVGRDTAGRVGLKMHPTDLLAALIQGDIPGSEGFLQ